MLNDAATSARMETVPTAYRPRRQTRMRERLTDASRVLPVCFTTRDACRGVAVEAQAHATFADPFDDAGSLPTTRQLGDVLGNDGSRPHETIAPIV